MIKSKGFDMHIAHVKPPKVGLLSVNNQQNPPEQAMNNDEKRHYEKKWKTVNNAENDEKQWKTVMKNEKLKNYEKGY